MIPSNLYATRVFSEHPIGLWPIDDEITYLSKIPKMYRDLNTWSGDISTYTFDDKTVADPPFNLDKTYRVSGGVPINEDESEWKTGDPEPKWYMTKIESPALFNFFEDLNHEQRVFSINAYIYHRLPAAFYDVGYLYNNGDGDVLFTERIEPGRPNEWIRIGRTFDQQFLDLDARIYIKAYFPYNVDTSFLLNGVSVGQWSESLSHQSTGVYPKEIDYQTGLPLIFNQKLQGLPINEYGAGNDDGYIFVQKNRLLASNGGVPLVYGSDSVTSLVSSDDSGVKVPSLVVPGKGFMNASGRFNNLTLEAWIRVSSDGGSHRIIGPVSSNDGIYIDGSSIALVIGKNHKSYSVGNWYRPMLLHVNVKDGEASVLLNGDRVITMPYSAKSAKLPDNRLRNDDWIGFYAWQGTGVFEVDSISIYPYTVHTSVAKRRFVWGQGVESPETINSAYLGVAHTVDFSCSNYSTNHVYPSSARWDAGVSNNLNVTNEKLSPMDYTLPTMITPGRTTDSVMDYSLRSWKSEGGREFMSFASKSPNGSYIFFSNSDKVIGNERMFYAIFGGDHDGPLFMFEHKVTGAKLRCDIAGGIVTYKYNDTKIHTHFVSDIEDFTVGVNFNSMGNEISSLMSNPSLVELYVCGDKELTYTGKLFKVGISNSSDFALSASYENGFTSYVSPSHTPQYALRPIMAYGNYTMDIDTHGVWSETYPLSYFANNGVLELMQFNISANGSGNSIADVTVEFNKKTVTEKTAVQHEDISIALDLRDSKEMLSKRYSIPDGTVMMFDGNVNDIFMTLTIDIRVFGIISHNFAIKNMSIASVGNAEKMFMEIGTQGGQHISPYSVVGNYYTNKVTRPWSVYKFSSPYLYLTNDSGIRPLNRHDDLDSGLWITMNKNKVPEFNVSAIQMWLKYSDEQYSDDPVTIFEVHSEDKHIKFVGQNDGTNRRMKLYAIDAETGQDYTELTFHQDGNLVITPFLDRDHWTSIGIDFEPMLDISNDMGSIRLVSSCVFNNIVFYQTSSKDEQYIFAYRTWQAIRNDGKSDLTWGYWKDSFNDGKGATWDEVSKAATINHGISIDDIYKTYVGTNRFVVDDLHSSLMIGGGTSTTISGDLVKQSGQGGDIFVNTRVPKWKTYSIKPV